MASDPKQHLLARLPSITELLKAPAVARWLQTHPQPLVTECLRRSVAEARTKALEGNAGDGSEAGLELEAVVAQADTFLEQATRQRLRHAINATGIILHTGLGRAVFPASVVNSMQAEANQAVESLSVGGDVNPAEVLTAVQKADLAFRLTMQIRNKLVAAYQEVQNIRI